MTARRVHQLTITGLLLAAFLLGSFVADWVGMAVLAVTALLTLVGGWWPRADLVQQLASAPAERRGVLLRREPAQRDRTWRLTRMVEGATCLLAASLVTLGAAHVGWGFDLAGWLLALVLAGFTFLDGLLDARPLDAVIHRRPGSSRDRTP